VYFLIAADVPAALTGKLMNLMTERFTLKLSDPTEYSGIVGRGAPADLSNVYGRGYVRVGNQPLEFQTALAFKPKEGEGDEVKRIGKMAEIMKKRWNDGWGDKSVRPYSIDMLPLRVSLEKLTAAAVSPTSSYLTVLMGMDDHSLQPYWLNLERQGPHMLVIGQPFSGKTTALRTILLSMTERHSPAELLVVLVDFSSKLWRGTERSLGELAHVVATISTPDELDDLLENLRYECESAQRRKILLIIDNYDAFTDEASRKKSAFFEGLAG
jgi:S-DNA-T family DNA segregation ATPase FtsK/SpoIIIE